ncbi:hypothetical protein GOP47_0026161 [Adiantum capillus-veneris]|uniref:F-box domain-containing protein n=1 Tax=Adiantum capillus-veneris TaxID=13818 RepID=A0A9D4Z482_ADICA|nr:hypothetical protein GOP47_0026161 [Adiantum capillus-veneris]
MSKKTKQLALVKDSGGDGNNTILPGIPDEIALLCLARLPSRVQAQTCCVSLCWKRAMESQVLFSLRLQLCNLETKLLLCFNYPRLSYEPRNTYSWWIIDQLHIRYFPIKYLPCLPLHDPVRPIATASPREVLLLNKDGNKLCRVDLFRGNSCPTSAPVMLTNREYFASTLLDGYVYAVGGFITHSCRGEPEHMGLSPINRPRALKSVERLDCTHMLAWESLPDMHHYRGHAAVVVRNGQLYVIGGKSGRDQIYSGEIWDPDRQEWRFMPELWPQNIFDSCSARGRVAVVMGHLVAMKEWTHELMAYEDSSKQWVSVGYLPFVMLDTVLTHPIFSCMLVGQGEELWVVVQRNFATDEGYAIIYGRKDTLKETCILACTPFSQELNWRRLPYVFDASSVLCSVIQVMV